MPVMPSLTPDSLMLCRWAQSPALTLTIIHTRARARLARQGSARCYGVARQRERSRQNSIGGSGVLSLRHFGAGSPYPLARGCRRNLARRRQVSAGAMRLDRLGPPGRCRPHDGKVAGGAVADLV
jgi:hypothetical protein